MPPDKPVEFKYKSKCGYYYRDLLKSIVEGTDPPIPPD